MLATNAWCGGPSLKPGRVGRGAFPFTGQPVLETADGTVWGAAAVCRYLALAAGKLDASALAVDQWLEWEDTRLAPLVRALSGANVSFPLPEPVRAPVALGEKLAPDDARRATTVRAARCARRCLLSVDEFSLVHRSLAETGRRRGATTVPDDRRTAYSTRGLGWRRWKARSGAARPGTSAARRRSPTLCWRSARGVRPACSTGHFRSSRVRRRMLHGFNAGGERSLDGKAKPVEFDGGSLLETMQNLFTAAIGAAFPALSAIDGDQGVKLRTAAVSRCNNAKFGDFQCNSPMAIHKRLKGTEGCPATPLAVGNAIIAALPPNNVVGTTSVAPAGCINVSLVEDLLLKGVQSILADGVRPTRGEKKKVLVDFSSPNLAKEMQWPPTPTIIGDLPNSRVLRP